MMSPCRGYYLSRCKVISLSTMGLWIFQRNNYLFYLKFIAPAKRIPFGLRKGFFWLAKGFVLETERTPFVG